MVTAATGTSIERYQDGWRSGKPVEDPDKLKRWGYVGAKPSEYLVCTKRGVVDRARSGQGLRIFKWPWESVAIVPTTLQRIEFTADQITREHVGVGVTGIAVYRIAEPLLACRVLNYTYGEAASEKLAATLREMFVGAARRLIANLTLQDCLTRRKEAIAGFLMDEISPVVGGFGSLEDSTTQGWGVVIDTIEIQQVQITSEAVFAHLQAPYRAEIAARAELAELERQRQVADRRAETERLATEIQAAAQRRSSELERDHVLHQIAIAEEQRRAKAEEERVAAELRAAAQRRTTELARDHVLHEIGIADEQRRAKAAAEIASLEAERGRLEATQRQAVLQVEHARTLELEKQASELEHNRRQAELALELRRREAEARDHEGLLDATHQRRLAEIEQLLAKDRALQQLVTHALPQIAAALKQSYGTLNYTNVGGGANGNGGPLDAVPSAFAQLFALAKSFGLELPAVKQSD